MEKFMTKKLGLNSNCREVDVIKDLVSLTIKEEDFQMPAIKSCEDLKDMFDLFEGMQVARFSLDKVKATYMLGENQVYLFVPFFEQFSDESEEFQEMMETIQFFHNAFHEIRHAYQEQFWGRDVINSYLQREDAQLTSNPLELDANKFAYEMVEKYKIIIHTFGVDLHLIDYHLNCLKQLI